MSKDYYMNKIISIIDDCSCDKDIDPFSYGDFLEAVVEEAEGRLLTIDYEKESEDKE